MSQYDDFIQQAAQQYNVDPNLLRGVIQTESSGNPNVVSNAGAVGLMQIEPATAQQYGVTGDLKDPKTNIFGGAQILSHLLDTSPDVVTALRRYQGGDNQKGWGPVNAAYPGKVFAAGGIGQRASAPATLPGIPTSASSGAGASSSASNLSDDAVLSAFTGGSPGTPTASTSAAPANAPASDDAIFAAFSKTLTPASAAAAPAAQVQPQPAAQQPQPTKAQQAVLDIVRPDFNDALVHHLENLPLGIAQGAENAANWVAQKIAPGSSAADFTSNLANQTNAAMAAREQQYQQQTPTNVYSTLGAAAGEGLGALAGGGASLIAHGSDLAGNALARLDVGVAIALELEAEFGLRAEEAVRAIESLDEWERALANPLTDGWITVIYGTKGGKARRCPPLDRARALELMHRAITIMRKQRGKLVVKPTLVQALSHYHYVVRKAGMTSENAPHSLRYAYACEHLRRQNVAGVSPRDAAAGVSTWLGHGDGRGTWIEKVYGREL